MIEAWKDEAKRAVKQHQNAMEGWAESDSQWKKVYDIKCNQIDALEKVIKDVIIAIECGVDIDSEGSKIYKQRFGEGFLNHLKKSIGKK